MRWSEVLADPTLRNLPYKIELNEYGKIVMPPVSNRRGSMRVEIALRLSWIADAGKVIAECSVDTRMGVRVADVAWCSPAFIDRCGLEGPYPEAPDICVEIVSPPNSGKEVVEKRLLYFEQGANEAWIVSEAGEAKVFGPEGLLPGSPLAGD